MTRLASSGNGERAGGSGGGGFRPGIQTRHRSRKAKDAGKHFFLSSVWVYEGKERQKGGRTRLHLCDAATVGQARKAIVTP